MTVVGSIALLRRLKTIHKNGQRLFFHLKKWGINEERSIKVNAPKTKNFHREKFCWSPFNWPAEIWVFISSFHFEQSCETARVTHSKTHINEFVFAIIQFHHCPWIWICHRWLEHKKVDKLHENVLQLYYAMTDCHHIKINC